MIKSIALGAVLSMVAIPCFAQPYPYPYPPAGLGNYYNYYMSDVPVGRYRAVLPPETNNGPGGTVIRESKVIGRDPDPFIREELGRAYPERH